MLYLCELDVGTLVKKGLENRLNLSVDYVRGQILG